jgi:Ca2+-binding EF-hand superfamily protein
VSACRKNGNNASEASLKDAFKIFDIDSDGVIDFDGNFLTKST